MQNAKEQLVTLREVKRQIDFLEDELLAIDTKLQRITKPIDKERGIGEVDLGDLIISVQSVKSKINAQLKDYYSKYESCLDLLECINGKYKTIITLRYLKGYPWTQIAYENSYSLSQVYRIHGEALKRINIKINKKNKR